MPVSNGTLWLSPGRVGPVTSLPGYPYGRTRKVAMAALMPRYLAFSTLNPLLAGVLFGFVTGAGLLALFRHGSSLGGIGIVALMVQDRTGFRAGWLQMGFDAVLVTLALIWIPAERVLWSLPGMIILNAVLAINHRRDRYVAT